MNRILIKINSNGLRKLFLTVTVTLIYAFVLNAQDRHKVTGTVSDASGTISGVNVLVKGTSVGAVTDAGGKYSIEVPGNNSTLVFSLMGFATQEITPDSRTELNVTLAETAEEIEEIVFVGYGTAKKADLAGNVTTLNARDIQNTPVAKLSNALAGRLAGVGIQQGSGGKPGNSAEMIIGARGTWNSTSPLYVIDGVVRDAEAFNMLSSSDIEAFTVLKDASAAAVYGARAANGVFLINTKKGKSGKPTISYSGSYTAGEPAYEPRMESFETRYRYANAGQMEMRNLQPAGQQITKDGYVPYATSIYKNGKDASGGYLNANVFSDEAYAYYSTHQYDRLAEVYQTPITKTHSLNVSGGNDVAKYYIGGNYYDETGIFKAVGYKKSTIRSSMDLKITDNLTASLAVNLGNDNNQSAYGQDERMAVVYRDLSHASRLAPGMVNGKYIVNDADVTNGNNNSAAAIANGDAGLRKVQNWFSEYTAGLKWEIPWVKGLTAQTFYNRYTKHEYVRSEPKKYEVYSLLRGNDATTEYAKNGGKDPNGNIIVPELGVHTTKGNDWVEQSETWSNTYQFNAQLSYNNTFGKHALEGVLVYEQTESNNEWVGGNKPNLKVESRPYLNFGGDTDEDKARWGLWGGAGESGRISYVGRIGYTFDNRYQASFSFREDLSSKFGPDIRLKSGFFPAGNVYWRVSEESFLKNLNWLNNLKLRASIGLTGNDAVSAFQYLSNANIGSAGMLWGTTAPGAGVSFGKIANPTITWEKSVNRNVGLDLGLFNMFTLSANLWKKHTYDILGQQTGELPDTFGGTLSDVNYGIVDSYGFDLEIGFSKQINNNVSVWAKGNFGWAENKLIEYAETGIPDNVSKIGKNYDRWALMKSDGIVWDLRTQVDNAGNQVTKDYGDGRGVQKMYVATTSNGNTYIIPENYWVADAGHYIDHGGSSNLRPGYVFPLDLNGDGHADKNDMNDKYWAIEHMNPPYNFGLLLGGSWKGFSVEALLQGLAGNKSAIKVYNSANSYWYGAAYDFWSSDVYSVAYNPTGKMPIGVNGPSDANVHTDFWIRNASFVRLKNVTLSYDLPKSLLSKLRLSAVKLFVSGQNLCFLYNGLKYYDPEMTSSQNLYNNPGLTAGELSPNSDIGIVNYPLMRTVTFGLNLSF